MNITDSDLVDVATLTKSIKLLFLDIKKGSTTRSDAIQNLDEIADIEIKGACRGDIMQILDNAANILDGGAPAVVEDTKDIKLVHIPKSGINPIIRGSGE